MVTNLRQRGNSLAGALIAAAAIVAAFAATRLSGTKTGLVLSLGTVVGPALFYIALVAPLVFPFGLYASLTPFDNILNLSDFGTLTRLVGLASGAALLFFMLRRRRFGDPHPNLALWILLYLWMAASALWAIVPEDSISMIETACQLLALYAVVTMFRPTLQGLNAVLVSAWAGGLAAACYGVYLYHTGAGVFGARLWIRTDNGAWNPDQYAAALMLPIALSLYAFLSHRNLWLRAAGVVSFGVMVMALFLSGARGALLGFVILILYVFIRDTRRNWPLLLWGIPILGIAIVVSGTEFLSRWGNAIKSGGAGRTDIWKVGWLAFKQHWLIGAGYNNFPSAYDRAFIQVFQPLFADWHRASHNIVVGTAVELGVVGLALLLLAWWGQFRLLRFINRADSLYPLRCALEGGLIALFVCGLFADIMTEKYPWLVFMVVALARNAAVERTRALRT